ncbi:azaleucine resistance protein AzlC [Bacillus cereus HuA3-9]|uniref:Azaleucine resistance protein AzlC n=2 Tax=Bacillus TaxID=1386 RepID=R8CK24_BACCE|nr:azaleucine resistance protein AzlC [Bacillus cereus HuA3-9]
MKSDGIFFFPMNRNACNNKTFNWKQGILDALPMGISFMIFGSVFGVMAIQVGLSPLESILMSLVSFAGSAQLSILPMLKDNSSLYLIFLTILLINARHLLYGLSLSPYFNSYDRKFSNAFAYFLSDAMYILVLSHLRQHSPQKSYILGAGLLLYITWGLGTLLGTMFSRFLPKQLQSGLEFSIVAIFLIMAFTEINSFRKLMVFLLTGVMVISLSSILPMGSLLLIAGIFTFGMGYFLSENFSDKEDLV